MRCSEGGGEEEEGGDHLQARDLQARDLQAPDLQARDGHPVLMEVSVAIMDGVRQPVLAFVTKVTRASYAVQR